MKNSVALGNGYLVKKNSPEWDSFVQNIEAIKLKSNRQVLCVKCWTLLNYEQKVKHLKTFEDHEAYILTSSKFASAWQISSLALACNKLRVLSDGEYLVSPFQEAGILETDFSACRAKEKLAEKHNKSKASPQRSAMSFLNLAESCDPPSPPERASVL